MSDLIPAEMEGRGLLVADAIGTVAFLLVTILLAVTDSDPVQILGLVVAGVMFLGGCVGFTVGFLRAVGRSRDEDISMAGLFYLTGSATKEVQRAFMGLWFAQIAIATASIAVSRPPFGVMAPVWGIGLIAWWGSKYATFPPRQDARRN